MKKRRRTNCAVASLGIFVFFQIQSAAPAETNSLWSGLLAAISNNNVDQIKSILKMDAALANPTNVEDPPLVLAASQTNLEIITVLLDAGADVDRVGWSRSTALYKILEPMLFHPRFRPPVNQPSNDFNARLTIARVLLEHGASIFSTNAYRGSLINEAAQGRNGDLVDFLLLNQLGKNARDADGNSMVHIAALWARTNVLKELAERKCDLEATNFAGLTPLQAVSRLPHYEDRRGEERWFEGFSRRMPGLDADGPKFRQLTANLLVSLGARRDIFSAIALGWTGVAVDLLSQNPALPQLQNAAGQIPLHWAAEFGETNIARLLLQAGSAIESTDRQGQRPLDLAAAKSQNNMAELLMAHGALVNRPVGLKAPLHWAAEQGNTPLLDLLLKAGADPNAEDEHHQTALDWEARGNHVPEVKLLLACHARFAAGTNNATTPLHSAVANSNTNLMALLLQHGADINARNKQGQTPLLLAHERDDFPVLEFLLAHGANINVMDLDGNTALHLRAASGSDLIAPPRDPFKPMTDKAPAARSMMEFLLEHGAHVNATNFAGETPLHRVAGKSFSTKDPAKEAHTWIQPLLDHHANLDARDKNGRTVFQLAALNYNVPLVEALLKLGAEINARDRSGATALLLDLKNRAPFYDDDRQMAFFEWLLKHGARVNIADKEGTTPLHSAVTGTPHEMYYSRMERTAALLLKFGANVNAMDSKGRTPLHLACNEQSEPPFSSIFGYDVMLPGDSNSFQIYYGSRGAGGEEFIPAMLLTNGARVNVRDHEGNTPLHYAAEAVRSYTIKLLLNHHANRVARNNDGKTPLDLAYEQAGGFQVVPLLLPPNVSGEIGDAARRNDLEMAKAFLKDDPRNANASWLWGSTPLHWACNEGNLEMVKLLLAYGAEVNPPRHDLDDATRMVQFNRIQNYLQANTQCRIGNDVVVTNRGTRGPASRISPFLSASPLQLALANSHFEIARLLVKHGAKADLASAASLGMNGVIQRAMRIEPQRINEYSVRGSWYFQPLQNHTFQWSPDDNVQSGTLLHFAVRGNQPTAVKYLLEAGADRSMLDDEGRTPRQLAVEMKFSGLVDLFNGYTVRSLH